MEVVGTFGFEWVRPRDRSGLGELGLGADWVSGSMAGGSREVRFGGTDHGWVGEEPGR